MEERSLGGRPARNLMMSGGGRMVERWWEELRRDCREL